MHQSSSLSKSHLQKSSSSCKTKMEKQKQRVRNPFQDLNIGNAAAAGSSSNGSSVSSIEASKGCSRFFLSRTSNKTSCSNGNHGIIRTKLVCTPKSAPNLKENSSKRFNFHKPQKLERLKKNSAKVSSVVNSNGSSENKLKSDFGDFDGLNLTPAHKVVVENGVATEKSKVDCSGNTESTSSNSKTPPVQASVSPEIQCGSSMAATVAKAITPVCYGAGFVVSGVTDKRKCRPRGILTIGEAKPLSCFDCEDEIEEELGLDNDDSISELPFPFEASMQWLLSPCNEEDEDKKEDSESEFFGFSRLEDCVVLRNESCSAALSPSKEKNCYDHSEEISEFSPASLSSGNVIQTPQSDCSSDRQPDRSWLNTDSDRKSLDFDYKLDSIAEGIEKASLSHKSYVSIWDPAGSSFQFDCLSSPSTSVDLSHFQKVLDDRTSWLSDSTMENVSQSHMRISWREGLVSKIIEMDECDSCRCLSDVEDDAIVLESHCSPMLKSNAVNEPVLSNDSGSNIDLKSSHENDSKVQEKTTHQEPCTCAESISTDAGSLIRSDDSDWTLSYKNNLFQ